MPRTKPGQYPISKERCGAINFAQATVAKRQEEVAACVEYQMFERAQADLNTLINEIGVEMKLAGRNIRFEARGDKYYFMEGGPDDPVVGEPPPVEEDEDDEDEDEGEDVEDSGVGAAAAGSD
jgi:hypothetical protein